LLRKKDGQSNRLAVPDLPRAAEGQGTLSVVVPIFNEGVGVVRCLERLRKLDGIHEVILVDASDASDSLAILSDLNLEAGVVLERTHRKGRSRQMNMGASIATGRSLLFLHCDTELPDRVADVVASCLQNNCWGRFDVDLNAGGWNFRMIETMLRLRSRFTSVATGDQAIFVRAEWFKEQGMFADLPLMEDIEFSRRVSAKFKPGLASAAVKTSARRWQKNGVWKTILLMWKLRFLFRIGVEPEKLAAMYHHAR